MYEETENSVAASRARFALSLRTLTAKRFPWRRIFCFDVGQSDQRIEYSSSDSSRAVVSWILARVTKYALEREFHEYNKVSYDVECWKNDFWSYVCLMWDFGFAL